MLLYRSSLRSITLSFIKIKPQISFHLSDTVLSGECFVLLHDLFCDRSVSFRNHRKVDVNKYSNIYNKKSDLLVELSLVYFFSYFELVWVLSSFIIFLQFVCIKLLDFKCIDLSKVGQKWNFFIFNRNFWAFCGKQSWKFRIFSWNFNNSV